MDSNTFLLILGGLMLFYTALGLFASRTVTTTDDYFLAGRNLGLFPVTFTLIATQLGGGMLLGTSQEAYSVGLYGIFYTLGMTIGFILLSLGIASRLQKLNISTVAEVFKISYKSSALMNLGSMLSAITMAGILTGQVVGARSIFTSLNINNEYIFIAFWMLIILYTVVGGMHALVMADTAQVIFIICVFFGIFGYTIITDPSSFINTIQSQLFFNSFSVNSAQLISIIVMPALFSLIEQDLAQRFFAARSATIATLSALCAGIFMLTFALIPIYFGIRAALGNMTIKIGSSPLIPAIESVTNEFVLILAICGIFAAITSTADSLICATSSNMSEFFNFFVPNSKNKLLQSKIITALVGIGTLCASYFVPQNIISILINSYALSVNCLFIPLIAGYYHTNLKKSAAIGAILGGISGYFIIYIIKLPLENLVPLACSAIGFIIGLLF